MRVAELSQMLQDIESQHGDINVRCGQYSIGGIMLLKTQLPVVAVIVSKKVGNPCSGIAPHVGPERRKTPKRRCDD